MAHSCITHISASVITHHLFWHYPSCLLLFRTLEITLSLPTYPGLSLHLKIIISVKSLLLYKETHSLGIKIWAYLEWKNPPFSLWTHFYFIFIRERFFSEYKILDQQLLFSTVKTAHYLLAYVACDEQSIVILFFILLTNEYFSLFASKFCTISLVFSKLNMMYLGAFFFMLLLLGVYWVSWIYGFISFIKFGKILAIISSNITFAPHHTETAVIYVYISHHLHSAVTNNCRIYILSSARLPR